MHASTILLTRLIYGIAKGIILRSHLYVHLAAAFPNFKELIEEYSSVGFYATHYGVDAEGKKIALAEGDDDGDDGDDDDGADEDAKTPTKGDGADASTDAHGDHTE